jgi:molybdopterin/thiamine biosynthesis adenylyltransferase
MSLFAGKRVLLVGAGGLGCPVGTLLARAGVGYLEILDDDVVDASNLHRQTLYRVDDVGQSKAQVAAQRLREEAARVGVAISTVAREKRLYPEVGLDTVQGFDLVVEGTDNYPSKFLAADACALAEVPCVQAGAVRWGGWAFGSLPGRSACLRCVFEDIPPGPDRGCAEAGVIGPVVGVVGALQAAIALRLLAGDTRAAGTLHHYRALPGSGNLRRTAVERSSHCPLCSGMWQSLDAARYSACAA